MPEKDSNSAIESQITDIASIRELWDGIEDAPWYAPLLALLFIVIYLGYTKRMKHAQRMAEMQYDDRKNLREYKLKEKEIVARSHMANNKGAN